MPNIVNVSDIQGKTLVSSDLTAPLTISPSAALAVIKVNSVVISSGTSGGTATVSVTVAATTAYIANSITVPANATLVALSKDTGIYLEYNATNNSILSVTGSPGCTAVVSYEVITTTS